MKDLGHLTEISVGKFWITSFRSIDLDRQREESGRIVYITAGD